MAKTLSQLESELHYAEKASYDADTKRQRSAAKKKATKLKTAIAALYRKSNPSPVTARKTAKGFVVSATVATMDAAKKLARKMGATPPRIGNVEQGFYAGGVFHPIRASSDYRPEALSGSEGSRARGGIRSTPRKKKKKKPAARMTATKKRKR